MNDENLPSYVKLFGEIDFREGDAARSVYSPAAYLTDLLQLIDDEMQRPSATDPLGLDQRRPDIVDMGIHLRRDSWKTTFVTQGAGKIHPW